MSLELEIALQQFLLPGLCSLVGCWILAKTDQGEGCFEDEPVRGIGFQTLFGVAVCAMGIFFSDLWQRGILGEPTEWLTWKPSRQWERIAWMIPGSMLAMGLLRCVISTPVHFAGVAGSLTASFAVGILYYSLNQKEVWEDHENMLLPWMAAGCAAAILNVSSLNSISTSGGFRWGSLVLLGQFGCLAAITWQSYASLGQWCIVGIGVALGASIVGFFSRSTTKLHYVWPLSIVVLPLGIMAVVCSVLSPFFFQSHTLPLWLTGAVLFLPTLVWVIDLVFGRLYGVWMRVFFAGSVCGLTLGAILYITKPWL